MTDGVGSGRVWSSNMAPPPGRSHGGRLSSSYEAPGARGWRSASAVLNVLPVAWALALAFLLLVLCLPEHGPEVRGVEWWCLFQWRRSTIFFQTPISPNPTSFRQGSSLLVLLVLGFGIALYASAALGYEWVDLDQSHCSLHTTTKHEPCHSHSTSHTHNQQLQLAGDGGRAAGQGAGMGSGAVGA